MPCFESDGIHASRIEFKPAYLDLKKGLLLSLIAVPISDCALTNANAIFSMFSDCLYVEPRDIYPEFFN